MSGGAAAADSLDQEGIAQQRLSVRNSQQPVDHAGHSCCLAGGRRGARFYTATDARRSLVGFATDGSGRAMALALRCRSWGCPCCRGALLRRNRARAIRGACRPGSVVRFVTLTIKPDDPRWLAFRGSGPVKEARGRQLNGREADVQSSIRYASASWNRLRLALVREFGEAVHYYRAIETHKSGMAHLHLLIRVDSLQEWFIHYARFRDLAVSAGFGPVLDVQAVKSKRDAAAYVVKATAAYVTKDPETGESGQWLPKYTRRGSVSREWCEWTPPTRLAGFAWRLAECGPETARRALIASDFVVTDPELYRVASGKGVRDGAADYRPT